MSNAKTKNFGKKYSEDDSQRWFVKEDLQDLAKIGSDFLKKTVASGMDVLKDVKENLPKEASGLLNKGKEELMRGLSQETAKSLAGFCVEKLFKLACDHRLEFSVRIRKNDELGAVNNPVSKKKKSRK